MSIRFKKIILAIINRLAFKKLAAPENEVQIYRFFNT